VSQLNTRQRPHAKQTKNSLKVENENKNFIQKITKNLNKALLFPSTEFLFVLVIKITRDTYP